MRKTTQYVARRLYYTEWTPTDQSYEKDLGIHLVLPDDPKGERERIPLKGIPLDVHEDDQVQVTITDASFHVEIITRVVTERRPFTPRDPS